MDIARISRQAAEMMSQYTRNSIYQGALENAVISNDELHLIILYDCAQKIAKDELAFLEQPADYASVQRLSYEALSHILTLEAGEVAERRTAAQKRFTRYMRSHLAAFGTLPRSEKVN